MRALNSSNAPSTAGNYSQAVEVQGTRTVYVSGQIPVAVDGTVPDGFDAQARLAFANVEHQLAEAGMDFGHVAKLTVYLSAYAFRADLRRIRKDVLGDHMPALTVIIAYIFDPAWLLEIEAIAVD